MKILLTCFEPFGGLTTNSSEQVFNKIELDEIYKVKLPVTYAGCKKKIKEAIHLYNPDFVICLGQAGGYKKISLEKVGINYTRANIADNDGVLLKSGKVDKNGADAYFTSFPIEEIIDEFNNVFISLSAGGFICNSTYYIALKETNGKALFIHLPYYANQGEELTPFLDIDEMVTTVNAIIAKIKRLNI